MVLPFMSLPGPLSLDGCQIRKRAICMHVPHTRRLNVAQLEDVRAQCRRVDAVGAENHPRISVHPKLLLHLPVGKVTIF